jgi:hypothetical protein
LAQARLPDEVRRVTDQVIDPVTVALAIEVAKAVAGLTLRFWVDARGNEPDAFQSAVLLAVLDRALRLGIVLNLPAPAPELAQ